jgi:hypothetical protein
MKQLKIIAALVAGLFAFSSANAGEMTVTGSMHASYQSNSENETGNPLGMNTDLTFTGTTEVLDGIGVTWTMGTDGTFAGDAGADHKIVFASPYGNFKIGNSGDSANAIDDITPTAFEEANGSGSGTYSTDFGSGMEGSMSLGYSKADIMGSGVSIDYTLYPKLDVTTNNEKGASGGAKPSSNKAQSVNIQADIGAVPGLESAAGLKLAVGYEISESLKANLRDKEGATVALNYATGPIKVGYQRKGYQALSTSALTKSFFKDDIYGIAYAINDELAVSYNVIESLNHTDTGHIEQKNKCNQCCLYCWWFNNSIPRR